ncbi:MAG: PIG-L deacetylase family protein [Verrucomicrobiales bacterium]
MPDTIASTQKRTVLKPPSGHPFLIPEPATRSTTPKTLAIGAHSDDVELGCGGTLRRLAAAGAEVHLCILTSGLPAGESPPLNLAPREWEAVAGALTLGVPRERVHFLSLPDRGLHIHQHAIIRGIEEILGAAPGPPFDLMLTHTSEDTHGDHRAACEATRTAARNFFGTILHYAAPSTRMERFCPAFFVELSESDLAAKVGAIHRHASQVNKPFMGRDRTRIRAEYWAQTQRLPPGRYAEAFEIGKIFWTNNN